MLLLSTLRDLRSTIRPYTTLFRSEVEGVQAAMILGLCAGEVANPPGRKARPIGTARQSLQCMLRSSTDIALFVAGLRDRKSTRLNSSHLVISYAVFCLKNHKI